MLRLDTTAGALVKRGIDLTSAAAGLIVLSPVLLLIAIAIRLDSRGPIFFRQTRVGRKGQPFSIWKFRTMRIDVAARPNITVKGDPRVSRAGRFLRATKLDELPQLINVLWGEMSLVGPRPEVPEYVAHYDARDRRVLMVRPGITDPASLRFRNEEDILAAVPDPLAYYRDVLMKEKIRINLHYLESATAFSDLGLIFRTLSVVFGRGRGET